MRADGTALASTSESITNLTADTYILSVTDAKGCSAASDGYTITEPYDFDILLSKNPDCEGLNAEATIVRKGQVSAFDNTDATYGNYTIAWVVSQLSPTRTKATGLKSAPSRLSQ